jgi:hypothetical protein
MLQGFTLLLFAEVQLLPAACPCLPVRLAGDSIPVGAGISLLAEHASTRCC